MAENLGVITQVGGAEQIALGAVQRRFIASALSDNVALAAADFEMLMRVEGWPEEGLPSALRKILATTDAATLATRRATLLNVWREKPQAGFGHIQAIRAGLDLAEANSGAVALLAEIEAFHERVEIPVRFSYMDLMRFIEPPRLKALLQRVKYRTFSWAPAAIRELAGRLDLPHGTLQTLRTTACVEPAADWETKVREAFAFDVALMDFADIRDDLKLPAEGRYKGLTRLPPAVLGPQNGLGALVVCIHAGFINVTCQAYRIGCPDGLLVSKGTNPSHINIADPRAALFAAYRAISDGKSVLLSPDGLSGADKCEISIFGLKAMVSSAAAFLAYETGCRTVWLNVERDDDWHFRPVWAEGPVRAKGEAYATFRERWLKFFVERIECFLRGRPEDLALGFFWLRLLRTPLAMDQTIEAHERIAVAD